MAGWRRCARLCVFRGGSSFVRNATEAGGWGPAEGQRDNLTNCADFAHLADTVHDAHVFHLEWLWDGRAVTANPRILLVTFLLFRAIQAEDDGADLPQRGGSHPSDHSSLRDLDAHAARNELPNQLRPEAHVRSLVRIRTTSVRTDCLRRPRSRACPCLLDRDHCPPGLALKSQGHCAAMP
eukprot:6202168-Pleurochrysis_carterae.AAC.1